MDFFVGLWGNTTFAETLQVVKVLKERVDRQVLCLVLVHVEGFLVPGLEITAPLTAELVLKVRLVQHLVFVEQIHLLTPTFRVGQIQRSEFIKDHVFFACFSCLHCIQDLKIGLNLLRLLLVVILLIIIIIVVLRCKAIVVVVVLWILVFLSCFSFPFFGGDLMAGIAATHFRVVPELALLLIT